MAELLFIQPSEITKTTVLGGNVDIDKYQFCIVNAQISVIEPLLGTELYDYIITNIATLSGDYLTLFNEFVRPITKNEALAEYIEISSYTLDNAGLFKHSPENAEVVDKEEAQFLAGKYHALAQMYVGRFHKWICKNTITEYKTYQDEVNASKNIKLTGGWFLGRPTGLSEDELW
jgi:hypothetical protein